MAKPIRELNETNIDDIWWGYARFQWQGVNMSVYIRKGDNPQRYLMKRYNGNLCKIYVRQVWGIGENYGRMDRLLILQNAADRMLSKMSTSVYG